MTMFPRDFVRACSCRLVACGWLAGAVLAQGPYFVDGELGADVPGNGATAAAPWRTIGYALAHVPPPASGAATVFVQGGQTYAAATNGESFPIAVPSYVAIAGVVAPMLSAPVLQPPATSVALQLDANLAYANTHTLLRWLAVRGGDVGLALGAATGVAHRLVVEDCEFAGQATAGVQDYGHGGIDDVVLRRCEMSGPGGSGRGVQNEMAVYQAAQTIVLEQCRLQELYEGVASADFTIGANQIQPTIRLRSCNIESCTFGARCVVPIGQGPKSATYVIEDTRIADCGMGFAVGGGAPNNTNCVVTIRDSSFVACGTGVWQFWGGGWGIGSVSAITIERATFLSCATGIQFGGNSDAGESLYLVDCCFFDNQTAVRHTGTTFGGTFSVRGCRFLYGVHGIDGSFDCTQSTANIVSTLFARLRGDAIRYYGSLTQIPGTNNLKVHHVTIADCLRGIVVSGCGAQSQGSHIVFSGNATDLTLSPGPFLTFPVSYSVSDRTSLAGVGNLPQQDVRLIRPTCKLAPNSPCRDAGIVTANTPLLDYEGDPRSLAAGPGQPTLPDLGADEYSPGGSLHVYGTGGCGPLGVRPRIGSPSPGAAIGGSYQVELSGAALPAAPSSSFAWLATGFADDPRSLPLDLAVVGMSGSYLWLEPTLVDPAMAVTPTGTAVSSQSIPNVASFVGWTLQHQWLVALPAPGGFVVSDALRVTLGV